MSAGNGLRKKAERLKVMQAIVDRLNQCTNYDPRGKKAPGPSKWRTVNVPGDLWKQILSAATTKGETWLREK